MIERFSVSLPLLNKHGTGKQCDLCFWHEAFHRNHQWCSFVLSVENDEDELCFAAGQGTRLHLWLFGVWSSMWAPFLLGLSLPSAALTPPFHSNSCNHEDIMELAELLLHVLTNRMSTSPSETLELFVLSSLEQSPVQS